MREPDVELDAARIAVADAMRDVTHALMGHHQDVGELRRIQAELTSMMPTLTKGEPVVRSLEQWGTERRTQVPPADGEQFPLHIDRPVSGAGNPWSIPLVVVRRGDRAVSTVTLGAALEGAPGRSHGGVVSAIFDDLAGYILALNQTMAYTAWLKIDYLAGTPLHRPITFSAWLDDRLGRKLHMAGECVDDADGTLLSRCEGLFVMPREQ